MALEITESNFESEILNSDKIAVVDFWAAWCGPCKILGPIVEDLSKDFSGRAVVGKCDVDANPGVSAKYSIRNIPTILFFKKGEVVDKHVGVATKDTLAKKVEALM